VGCVLEPDHGLGQLPGQRLAGRGIAGDGA
jgi:hypothetical protein